VANFELRERIARPADDVFALITDPDRARAWLPEITALEVVGGGPPGPGTTLRETRRVMGRQATTELHVRAYEPPRRYEVANLVSGVETVAEYLLTPEDGATTVRLRCRTSASGLKAPVAALTGRIMRRQMSAELAKLKATGEAKP
jgi:uncharacterized protein YndB with AHSA1/START domain